MSSGAGWGGEGGVGGGKTPSLGHPTSSHDAHTVVRATYISKSQRQWEKT